MRHRFSVRTLRRLLPLAVAAGALAAPAVASAQQLDVADDSVFEDPGAEIWFNISRGAPTGGTTTAQYTVSPGTAMAGSDYMAPFDNDSTPGDGIATFDPGVTTVRVTVPLVNDNLFEPDENLFLDLGTIINGTRGDDHGVGVIHDNDPNSPYWTAVMNDNPAHYFRMDDPGPPTMFNETGGADGTHVSDPIFGLAGALMSETPNLSVGYQDPDTDRSTFGVATHDAFTIEFWVFSLESNPAADDDLWYEGKGLVDGDISGPAHDSGVALVRNGHVGFGLGNPDTMIESTTAVNDGAWHHIAATSDGNGAMRLYVDEALEAQSNAGPTANRDNTGFTIGALNFPLGTTGEMLGSLDEVAFYPQALTQTDVSEHYHAAQGTQSRAQVRFSVIGGGYIAGPGISCRQGGAGCLSSELLGATRDYTAFPDAGYRLGSDSFLGDCTPFSANQCRVTADKSVESSLITFHKKADLIAAQLSAQIAQAAQAIKNGLKGTVKPPKKKKPKKKKPKKPPAQIALPLKPAPGPGDMGGILVTSLLAPVNPVKLISDNGSGLLSDAGGGIAPRPTDPAKMLSDAGGALISDKGGGIVSEQGAGVVLRDVDGNELIGRGAAPLLSKVRIPAVSSAGSPLASAAGKRKKGKRKKGKKGQLVTYVLGSYTLRTDGTGQVQPVFDLSLVGEKLLKEIGEANAKLAARGQKAIPLNTTFIEVFQPQDNVGTGGAFTDFRVK